MPVVRRGCTKLAAVAFAAGLLLTPLAEITIAPGLARLVFGDGYAGNGTVHRYIFVMFEVPGLFRLAW